MLKEYLEAYNRCPFYTSKIYENLEHDKELIINYNKELINKYPWLTPRNRWTGNVVESFDYSYTELDSMPEGWRIAFGEQLCEEIQHALEKINYVDSYRITQIKEKYGGLRWYDAGATREIYDIISKYENISYKTCIRCGKPAVWTTNYWISPFCDECKKELEANGLNDTFSELTKGE